MNWFLGIDGGQSSTVAVLGDEHGRIRARCVGPPTDLVGHPRDSVYRAQRLEELIAQTCIEAGLSDSIDFAAVVVGMSGYDARDGTLVPNITAQRFSMVHDTQTAHAAALAGEAGIVVIAGTGSVVVGNNRVEEDLVLGGWGYLFGDEGSAFWIAREAIAHAMSAQDRARSYALLPKLLEHFDVCDLRALQQGVAYGEISRARIAAFAAHVDAYAQNGDPDAIQLCKRAADALVALVATCDARLAPNDARSISYIGGVFESELIASHWSMQLECRLPTARIYAPRYEPAIGALLLAYRDARIERMECIWDET